MRKTLEKHLNNFDFTGSEAAQLLLKNHFMCQKDEDAFLTQTEKEAIFKSVRSSSESKDAYLRIIGTQNARELLIFTQLFTEKSLLQGLKTCMMIILHHGYIRWKTPSGEFQRSIELELDQSIAEFLKESFRYIHVVFALLQVVEEVHDIPLITPEIRDLKKELDEELENVLEIYQIESLDEVGIAVSDSDLIHIKQSVSQTLIEDIEWYNLFEKVLEG
jgi:hypothetical protein